MVEFINLHLTEAARGQPARVFRFLLPQRPGAAVCPSRAGAAEWLRLWATSALRRAPGRISGRRCGWQKGCERRGACTDGRAAPPGGRGSGLQQHPPQNHGPLPLLGWHAGRMGHFTAWPPSGYQLAQLQAPAILPVGGDLCAGAGARPQRAGRPGLPETPHPKKKTCGIWPGGISHSPPCLPGVRRPAQRRAAGLPCVPCGGQRPGAKVLPLPITSAATKFCRAWKGHRPAASPAAPNMPELYCAGLPAAVLEAAGFCERAEGSADILPNYLTPPLYENTDYYYFTSAPEQFVMFWADGDQDRPNLPGCERAASLRSGAPPKGRAAFTAPSFGSSSTSTRAFSTRRPRVESTVTRRPCFKRVALPAGCPAFPQSIR